MCYVGQSINTGKSRIKEHISEAKLWPKSLVSQAIRKFGVENFDFQVVAICIGTQQDFDDAEIEIGMQECALFPTGFNKKLGKGRGIWSEFQKQEHSRIMRDSEAHKAYHNSIRGLPHPCKGYKRSEEARLKDRLVKLGIPRSQKTCQKMSASHLGKPSNFLGRRHTQETRQKMMRRKVCGICKQSGHNCRRCSRKSF